MPFSTKYLPFWVRVNKTFWGSILAIILVVSLFYFRDINNVNYKPIGYITLGMGIYFLAFSIINSKIFINNITIVDSKMIVTGYNFNSPWKETFDIKTSNIEIKHKSQGRGNIEYYLKIISIDKKDLVTINHSLNWKHETLLKIFKEFKRIKGEKIIMAEKDVLKLIEKKIKHTTTP